MAPQHWEALDQRRRADSGQRLVSDRPRGAIMQNFCACHCGGHEKARLSHVFFLLELVIQGHRHEGASQRNRVADGCIDITLGLTADESLDLDVCNAPQGTGTLLYLEVPR
jgi:hypothetical protein